MKYCQTIQTYDSQPQSQSTFECSNFFFFFSANVRKSKANELANPTEANIVFENTDKGTIKCSFLKYIRESLTSRELQN